MLPKFITDFRKEDYEYMIRLWKISFNHKRYLIPAMITLMIITFENLLYPILFGKIANLSSNNFEEIMKNLNKYILFGIISTSILTIDHIVSNLFIMSFVKEIREDYYKSLLLKDIEFYDKHKTSYLFDILTGDISGLKNSLLLEFTKMVKETFHLIGAIFAMIYVSFRLTCLLIFIIPILYYLKKFTDKLRRKEYDKINHFQSSSHNMVLESLENIKIVKSFSTEKKEYEKYSKRLEEMYELEHNILIKTEIMDNLGRGIFVLGLIIVFKIGYTWLKDDQITKGNLTSFGIYSYILYQTFYRFGAFKNRITNSILSAERLFKIIDYKPTIDCKAFDEKNSGLIRNLEGNITLKNINFNYPSKKDVQVIKNLNINIKTGEKIGIVGLSGSGKSTIISLLERLYEINECKNSEILYDNINIKEYNLKNFHDQIGYVNQEPSLLDKSILENVIYGIDKYNENEVKKYLLMSKADFVYNKNLFPNGVNTIVGEKGSKLSGGQKQRIAIARALIKKPKILILDEATSALDSKSEFELQEELNLLNKDMTIIIVAHRLSTIKNCNIILVVDKGEIVEMGNHHQLIKLNGVYKELMEKQIGEKDSLDLK